jgi:hypothetical protein
MTSLEKWGNQVLKQHQNKLTYIIISSSKKRLSVTRFMHEPFLKKIKHVKSSIQMCYNYFASRTPCFSVCVLYEEEEDNNDDDDDGLVVVEESRSQSQVKKPVQR